MQLVNAQPGSADPSATTTPTLAAVDAPAADPPAPVNSVDSTPSAAAPTPHTIAAAATAPDPPASVVIAPTPAGPALGLVSTLVNAVLSPFANSAPTAPVQPPAMWTLLAFARREFEGFFIPLTTANPLAGQITSSAVDPDFISSSHNFGLFSITSAADPDDNNFVAFVFASPLFTDILTSGADPEDNLGFGAASIGIAGQTVNTFISPFLNFTVAIPITDPLAGLFTALVRLGF